MAQINFPTATADGQTFEAPTGVVYTYVGTPPNGYWSGTFQSPVLTDLDTRYLKLDASNDPITNKLQVHGGPTSIPALGVMGSAQISSKNGFGLQIGAVGGGTSYLQSGRSDGTATAYNLTLQPKGGLVGIGTDSPDTKLRVDSTEESVAAFYAIAGGSGSVEGLGHLNFGIGASWSPGARISWHQTGNSGYQTELSFSTRGNSNTEPVEALRIDKDGVINYARCPTYADDAAAGTGGLSAGDIYKTSTGELRIKL